MVKRLEIHDLPDSAQVQLALQLDDDRQSAPPAPFRNPLESSDRAEISWYFQEYLDYPFGAAKERAGAVEEGLRNLGRLLFESVFRVGAARDLLDAAVSEGLSNYQLSVISDRTEFMTLPWELLNSPESGYLAASLASLTRRATAADSSPAEPPLSTEGLNILLVAPCCESAEGVYAGGLTPSLIPVLESLDVQVELDFLRPPSFEALTQTLLDNPSRYHLVHLDGLELDDEGHVLLESSDSAGESANRGRPGSGPPSGKCPRGYVKRRLPRFPQ